MAAPARRVTGAALLALYTSAVFGSAFLLFLVQPMFGRMVLPLLGGTPAVWNTCMLFFQAALLGGYGYAHLSARLGLRRQATLHLLLLVGVALLLPVSVAGAVPEGGDAPVPWLLWLMVVTVGPPFLILAATGPLLQWWFSRSAHPDAHDPYRLYAASNLGSLLALLAYPLWVEPRLGLARQSGAWTVGYVLLGLLLAGCAAAVWKRPAVEALSMVKAEPIDQRVTMRERAIWTALAFVPSSLLLGVTTYLTTDLAPVPLLWVLPLALYLLSFTLVFAPRQLLPHRWMVAVQPALLATVALSLLSGFVRNPAFAIPVHLAGLFVTAMVCHGELARRRPAVRHLTEFYLWIALGGVLGGAFNALLAPALFSRAWEYPVVLVLACLARPWPRRPRNFRIYLGGALRSAGLVAALLLLLGVNADDLSTAAYVAVAAAVIALLTVALGRTPLWLALCIGTVLLVRTVQDVHEEDTLLARRSFFGQYRVHLFDGGWEGRYHVLTHGSTLHGAQSLDPERRGDPLTYYVQSGPLGNLFFSMGVSSSPRRVAVVGLGTGTTASYGVEGETWTFYEIDPGIERIARDPRLFTYLRDSPADIRVVLGDARLSLARAPEGAYDLILLDAFSSDAIPTHLLTREALELYLSRLAPGGRIAFHVSNRYLDLESVVAALVRDLGLAARAGSGPPSLRTSYEQFSDWIVVARTEEDLVTLTANGWRPLKPRSDAPPWTDDYSSLLGVFSW